VNKLKWTVCTKFRSQILCKRNFSDWWIAGVDSVRTSNIRDHASSELHNHAMAYLCITRSNEVASFTASSNLWAIHHIQNIHGNSFTTNPFKPAPAILATAPSVPQFGAVLFINCRNTKLVNSCLDHIKYTQCCCCYWPTWRDCALTLPTMQKLAQNNVDN